MNRPTLSEHLAARVADDQPADLAELIELLAATFVSLGEKLRSRPHSTGAEQVDATNPTGDDVHRIDLVAHSMLVEALKESPLVGCLASEEATDLLHGEASTTGRYCVVFDPLDGSNNLDSNGPVASIFGVFPRRTALGQACSEADLLRPGTELVAAGYALFSASTQFILCVGNGVHVFTLDERGAFRRSQSDLQIPDPGRRIFSVNDGHTDNWDPRVREYVETLRRGRYTARYVGTMAADVHRLMCHGGIYMHPADTSGPTRRGKLRALFEAIPLAFILEHAGGTATDGESAMLRTAPATLHEQRPVVFGSPSEVERFLTFVKSR